MQCIISKDGVSVTKEHKNGWLPLSTKNGLTITCYLNTKNKKNLMVGSGEMLKKLKKPLKNA